MRNALLVLLIALMALMGAVPVVAQKPPQVELGFKADGLYQFSGLDSVNLFNGNLIVQIPIGSAYSVDGGLKYGLTLVYNSKVWDYDHTSANGQNYTTSYPNWRSNAGVGWRLSMGRLIGPADPTNNVLQWIYEGPSGGEHVFIASYENNVAGPKWRYSVDQDRLRLVTPDTLAADAYPNTPQEQGKYTADRLRLVEFPNGEVHMFVLEHRQWRLRQMSDAFGNYVRITPTFDSDGRDVKWELKDSIGRTHTVTFFHSKYTALSIDRGQHVKSISLSTVAGQLDYEFVYESGASVEWGCGHKPMAEMNLPPKATLPLLARIVLPDDTSFGFEYYKNKNEGGFCSQGALRSLTVPTGGTFQYTYQQMYLPEDYCYIPQFPSWNPAVRTRTTPDGRWDYLPSVSQSVPTQGIRTEDFCKSMWANPQPNEMRTPAVENIRRWARMAVLSPPVTDAAGGTSRIRTDNYFYAWTEALTPVSDGFNATHPTTKARLVRYGQAVTTAAPSASSPGVATRPDDFGTDVKDADARVGVAVATPPAQSDTHYLSTRVYEGCVDEIATGVTVTGRCEDGRLLRSKYERFPYPNEHTGTPRWTYPAESSRVVHEDDTTCDGAACWVQTSASQPDGFGKYRTSKTSSNFSNALAVESTTTTNYLAFTGSGPWLLNRYDRITREEGGEKVVTDYSFNASTGFLEAVRVRADSTQLAANDVLHLFRHTKGNIEREEVYGGDGGGLPVVPTSPFDPNTAPRQYLTLNTFTKGVFTKSQVCKEPTSTTCESLLTRVDLDVHDGGTPKASRDPAGLETTYTYDTDGRLSTVTAPGKIESKYTYTAASTTSNANVREKTTDANGVVLSNTLYEFDLVGRVFRVTRSLPDAKTSTVTTTYDAMGRKARVTQPAAAGDPEFAMQTRYDALGRPTWVRGPDGKVSTLQYRGERWLERAMSVATSTTAEASVTVTEHYDAQRRLIKVEEYSGNTSAAQPKGNLTATTYAYDIGGRLVEAKSGTQPARTFTYDRRGFLTAEKHPESGSTTYGNHDARGHARTKTVGTGPTLTYEYDAAERLTRISNGTVDLKKFTFATANAGNDRRAGKLIESVRRNEVSAGVIEVTERYQYDSPAGQLSARTTSVEKVVQNLDGTTSRHPIQTFQHNVAYDSFNLPKTVTMPTCSLHGCSTALGLSSVTYDREAGYLQAVRNFATMTYAPSGMVRSVTHQFAGGTSGKDEYEPASGMGRPARILLAGSACPRPAPVIESATTICPGQVGTASVAGTDGTAYRWSVQGGTITSAADASTVTFRSDGSGSVTLSVTASNACGEATQAKVIAASSVLAAPVLTAPQSVCANGTGTASVPVNPDLTYAWRISSDAAWSATGASVTFPSAGAAFTLTVTASNSCGGSASSSKQIAVEPPSSATLYLRRPGSHEEVYIVRGSGETVVLKVVFPDTTSGPWELVWSDGVRETATQNPHERTVSPGTSTEYRLHSVSPQTCGGPAGIVYVKVQPPAPQTMAATTQREGQVFLTWTAVPGAGSYVIRRAATQSATPVEIAVAPGDATSLLYTPPLTAGPVVHFYYVLARDPEVNGQSGQPSPATAYDTAVTGTRPEAGAAIDSGDVQRLRAAIDAYRAAFGIGPAYGTAQALKEQVIAAADINDLVAKLNLARAANPFGYRDVPPPASNGFFYREHLQQLWDALR